MWRDGRRRGHAASAPSWNAHRGKVAFVAAILATGGLMSTGRPAAATPTGNIDNSTINAWPAGTSDTVDAGHWQAAELVANHTEGITGVVVTVSRHDDGCASGTTCEPLGDLTVSLWTVAANGLPGASVSSVTIPKSSIPNDSASPALVEADVHASPLEGQPLYLVMSTPTGTGGESYLWSQYDNTSAQTTALSNTQGTEWSDSTSAATASGYPQLGFEDYYNPTAPPSGGVVAGSSLPDSTTALTSSSDPSIYGQAVTFTASVSPEGNGLVYFTDNAEPVYSCYGVTPQLVNGSYQATCTISVFVAGSRDITAMYYDPNYTASSASVTQVIDPAPTHLSAAPVVSTSPSSMSPFTLEATLTRADNGRAVLGGTVTFSAGGTTICSALTDPDGVASCGGLNQAAAVLLAGGYTATFRGSADYVASSASGSLIG